MKRMLVVILYRHKQLQIQGKVVVLVLGVCICFVGEEAHLEETSPSCTAQI